MTRMLPGEVELVSELTGLPGCEVGGALRYIKTYLFYFASDTYNCKHLLLAT